VTLKVFYFRACLFDRVILHAPSNCVHAGRRSWLPIITPSTAFVQSAANCNEFVTSLTSSWIVEDERWKYLTDCINMLTRYCTCPLSYIHARAIKHMVVIKNLPLPSYECTLIYIIGAMVIVWRVRGKIVLCSIVCNSCA